MAKNTPDKSIKDRIIDAALALSAEEGWANITFDQILMAAGLSRDEAEEYIDDKEEILIFYGRRVDHALKQNVSFGANDEMSPRDKIFDILMERFDILNENRAAILSVLEGTKTDPKQMVILFPHLGKSMQRVLDLAGIPHEGIEGALKIAGLMGVYLYTVKSWKEDESADMAKTMAALDKALNNAESAANSFLGGSLMGGMSGLMDRFCSKKDF